MECAITCFILGKYPIEMVSTLHSFEIIKAIVCIITLLCLHHTNIINGLDGWMNVKSL